MKYLLICVSYGSGFQEVFNVTDETQRVKEKAVISSVDYLTAFEYPD